MNSSPLQYHIDRSSRWSCAQVQSVSVSQRPKYPKSGVDAVDRRIIDASCSFAKQRKDVKSKKASDEE